MWLRSAHRDVWRGLRPAAHSCTPGRSYSVAEPVLHHSVLFSAGPTRRWQARTKYLLPTVRSTCFLGNGLFSPFLSPPRPLDWPTPLIRQVQRVADEKVRDCPWLAGSAAVLDLYKSITTEQILWNALINGCHWTMTSSSTGGKA